MATRGEKAVIGGIPARVVAPSRRGVAMSMTPERRRWLTSRTARLSTLLLDSAVEGLHMVARHAPPAEMEAFAREVERRRLAIMAEPPPGVPSAHGADTEVGKESPMIERTDEDKAREIVEMLTNGLYVTPDDREHVTAEVLAILRPTEDERNADMAELARW